MAREKQRRADVLAVDVFVGAVSFGVDRDRIAFNDAQRQIAHDHPDGRTADVKAAPKHAARADDDGIEVVHAGIGVNQVLGADLSRGVKIVTADWMRFANRAVVDFLALVDAEGADVDEPLELTQSRSFQDVDRAQNIIGRPGIRIFLDAPADQSGGMHHRVDVEFFHRTQQRG